MKFEVSKSYKNDEDIRVNTVEVKGEQFENVPNASNYPKCLNCNYSIYCNSGERIVRKFDCKKNAEKVKIIFNVVTGIGVAIVAFLIALAVAFLQNKNYV